MLDDKRAAGDHVCEACSRGLDEGAREFGRGRVVSHAWQETLA
jgi:hypothetical protein